LRRRLPVRGIEDGEERSDRDRLAFLDLDLFERSSDRRWDLRIHLVGLHLDEKVVLVHLLARLLQPLPDRSFGDRLAELWHLELETRHLAP
jgi:hypothetical protein